METCGVNINFEKLLKNLECFCNIEKSYHCEMVGKIMRNMLPDNMSDGEIVKTFDGKFDDFVIENLVPVNGIQDTNNKKYNHSIGGFNYEPIKICSMPFYFMQILSNGDIYPCCTAPFKENMAYGNALRQNMQDIWMGEKHLKFLMDLLENKGVKDFKSCNECSDYEFMTKPADIIDDASDKLLEKYSKIISDKKFGIKKPE